LEYRKIAPAHPKDRRLEIESGSGTKRTCRADLTMSAADGKAEENRTRIDFRV